jgi:hypothetical protein
MEAYALAIVGARAGGAGMFKWGMSVERRIVRVEVKLGIDQ